MNEFLIISAGILTIAGTGLGIYLGIKYEFIFKKRGHKNGHQQR